MDTPQIKLHTIDDPDPSPVELTQEELAEQSNNETTNSGD